MGTDEQAESRKHELKFKEPVFSLQCDQPEATMAQGAGGLNHAAGKGLKPAREYRDVRASRSGPPRLPLEATLAEPQIAPRRSGVCLKYRRHSQGCAARGASDATSSGLLRSEGQ
jgi:hypothetical protein